MRFEIHESSAPRVICSLHHVSTAFKRVGKISKRGIMLKVFLNFFISAHTSFAVNFVMLLKLPLHFSFKWTSSIKTWCFASGAFCTFGIGMRICQSKHTNEVTIATPLHNSFFLILSIVAFDALTRVWIQWTTNEHIKTQWCMNSLRINWLYAIPMRSITSTIETL